MTRKLNFALNHITTPRLNSREFIDLARRTDCVGVELRNDLADKRLSERQFFDGENPKTLGSYARSQGVRLVGLSEVYAFNRWSDEIRAKVERLVDEALSSGAESISLIPSNDGRRETDEARLDGFRNALSRISAILNGTGLVALVEPLGFTTSSLRRKREAISVISDVGGEARFKLVHDTFHHFLAAESEFYPEWTGIVHISSVVDPHLGPEQMRDEHRVLVTADDRLSNIEQIAKLISGGYAGVFSYECFAPSVHASASLERDIALSFDSIVDGVGAHSRS